MLNLEFTQIIDQISLFANTFYYTALIITILFCMLIGSFINMLIYRIPVMLFNDWHNECINYLNSDNIINDINTTKKNYPYKSDINLFHPVRSICPQCKNTLSFKDNIPIISYIFLKGKCRHCQNIIPKRYLLVEILTVLTGIIIFSLYSWTILSFSFLLLTFILLIIAFIDLEHMIIPDFLSYIGLWLGLVLNTSNYQIIDTSQAIYGAVLGYLFLWSLYWLFKLTTHKEGFGHGDFKLTALFGAWLGAFALLPLLIIASITSIFIMLCMNILNKAALDKPFPFGPYLVFSGWITLIYSDFIYNIFNLNYIIT